MPEDFNCSRKLINAPDEDQSDESDEDVRHDCHFQASTNRKMRDIVQNFFNCKKMCPNKSNKESVSTKNKAASFLAKLMCQNIKQIRLDDSMFDCNTNSPTNVNDESCATDQNNTCKEDEVKKLLSRDREIQEKQKSMRHERDVLRKGNSEVRSKNDVLSFVEKVEAWKDNQHERIIDIMSDTTLQRTSLNDSSELGYDKIRESLMTENERLQRRSSCNAQTWPLTEVHGTKSEVSKFPRLKTFLQDNLKRIWKPRFHSGSVVLLNKEDTNVMFSPFKSDSAPIVDKTVTSQSMSTPDLLSGGTVVLEGFADSFRTPNYYVENPIIVNPPCDIPTAKSSTLISPPIEPRVFPTSFSGGTVFDNSSKGVSLPDIFPYREPTRHYRPSAGLRLSGGQLINSRGARNVSLDFLSKRLGVETVESSTSSSRSSILRANNPETTRRSLNESKSHLDSTDLSSTIRHSRRYSNRSRCGPIASEIHATRCKACADHASSVSRSSRNSSVCFNATKRAPASVPTRKETARPIPTARNVTEQYERGSGDRRRNRKSSADVQTSIPVTNPKFWDFRGRSRYL